MRQVRILGYYSPDREEVNRFCCGDKCGDCAATDALESTPAGPERDLPIAASPKLSGRTLRCRPRCAQQTVR